MAQSLKVAIQPFELSKMFLLGFDNEVEYNNLMKTLGLNQNMDYNEESKDYFINICLTKNRDRITPLKTLSCIELSFFEQIINSYYQQITKKYNLQNISQPDFDYKMQDWQKNYYDKLVNIGIEFRYGKITSFCQYSILDFISSFCSIYNDVGLNSLKKQYYEQGIRKLYVTFETYKRDENYNSIENIYKRFQEIDMKKKMLTFYFDEKTTAHEKYGESIIGIPLYTPNEKMQIQDNIQKENETLGTVKILTKSQKVIIAHSSEIIYTIPISEGTEERDKIIQQEGATQWLTDKECI